MNCPSCGTENLAGARFCMECASPLAAGCPACGFTNLPNAKFCSECATPLAGAAVRAASASLVTGGVAATTTRPRTEPASERRVVSVLFADIVGFTTLAEGQDSEDVRATLTRYFDLSREVIDRYGGTVEKFIGDAVMAVWGAPTAQEDDAERAVRAALDLVDAVRGIGPGIQARAGVLTGEAAVTIGATNQGLVAGDIVNTASRLQSVAQPGQVLVGEVTQRAAAGAIVFEEVGEQSLKGKIAPVAAWRALRVVAQRGGRGRSDSLEAPFVGRDEEMRLLKDLFHATNREQRPRLISVIGPGGIGKSRLAWEFLKYIDGLLERVWWHDGRSPAYGDGITFWALGEMVRGRAGLVEADDEATTRDRVATLVLEHVSDSEERAWIEKALLVLLGFESGVDPQQLFPAWRTFFERLAGEAPVVMVFEDLHFADSGLLDFIDHVMDWSRNVPITILTLARPEFLERRPTWGAGKRSFTSIYLEPLPADTMRQLLVGLVPGLPARATDAIVQRADGIPLYAVETVRMLLAQGKLELHEGAYRPIGTLDDIAVPESLTALIAARLDGLDPADRSLVADAATLGQSFAPSALAAVAREEVSALEVRLAGLVRRELLVLEADPRSPERGQYVFVQALIREVAYNTLSKADRKARHLAAARHFETIGSDELAGALAGHYIAAHRLAGAGPEADALAAQARVALRGAAERAAALGSHEQAITFLEQALDVTIEVADRAELHERALESAKNGLDIEVVMRHAEAVLAARRELGDRGAIARATAEHAFMVRSFQARPDLSLELLTAAWEEFSDLEDTPEGVALMGALAQAYMGLDRRDEAQEWRNRLLPIAERFDLLDETVPALIGRGHYLSHHGHPREGMILIRGAHGLAVANHLGVAERSARTILTFLEQWSEPAGGLVLAREGLAIAREVGSKLYGFSMVGNGTVCAIRVGEWEWAVSLLDEWITEDGVAQLAEFHADRAVLRALRGHDPTPDLDRTAELRAGITDPQYESYEDWARAWAAMSAGDLGDARRAALRAASTTSYFHPLGLPIALRASLWAGNLKEAGEDLRVLEDPRDRGHALIADQIVGRAGVLALEGRTAEAVALYRDALRRWRNLKLAWDEALTVIDMATLLDPSDPDVIAAGEIARATLTRLGATPYLERLEAELARGGPTPAAAPSRTGVRAESSAPSGT